ncbi:MAG: hypothetical protein ACREN1_09455 [Candidatus Dormibacteria bacterium]
MFDPKGLRHQALIANSTDPDIAYLEARHRLHASAEDGIKEAKECGLGNFPCTRFRANRVWLLLVQLAQATLPPHRVLGGGAEATALPNAARGWAAGAQRPADHSAARCPLAVGEAAGRRFRPTASAATDHLSRLWRTPDPEAFYEDARACHSAPDEPILTTLTGPNRRPCRHPGSRATPHCFPTRFPRIPRPLVKF